MGKQKGLFGTLLMIAGTVMMVVAPPFGVGLAVWYGAAIVTSYVGSVLAKQAIEDKLAEEQMGIQSTTSGTQAALPILYGTDVKTGSVLADIFAAGNKGEYLYSVNVLSVTPDNGQGIGGVKRTVLASEDGERLLVDSPTNGSYSSGGTAPSTGSYTSNYWYNYHLGDSGDNAVDPMMNSVSATAWPTTSKGYGLAYTVNKFKYDFADDPAAALFSNIPDLRFYVDGIKVKDFREDPVTYAASDNPILNLYDYLTSNRYGLGIDEAEIDIPSFTAAANYCDTGSDNWDLVIAAGVGLAASASATLATVNMLQYPIGAHLVRAQVGDTLRITSGSNAGDYTIAGTTVSGVNLIVSISPSTFPATDTNMSWELVNEGSTLPFQSSGALMTDSGHRRNIESLLVACRASLFWENGKFHVWIRQPETAETFELNADTNINDIEIIRPGSEDTPNVIEISFLNPNRNWTVDTLLYPDPEEAGTNPYLAEDNDIESRLKIELPMTSHPQVAFNIAEVMLKEARANTTVRVTATQAALQLSIGDVVKLTDDSAGWNAKEFWVMSIGITDENLVELVLQEYSLSAYTTTGTYTPGIVPGTDTPSPLYVPAPTSVNAVSDQTTFVTQADGTVLQYIHVTWTQSAAYNLEYEEIFYKKTSDTYYTLWNRTYQDQVSKLEIIGPVETGVEYTVAVQAVNSLGVRSVKATDTVTPEEKGQAPSDVTGLTSTPTCNRSIILDWDDSTDTDVRAYEVRYGGTDWATSTYYATVAASILTVPTEDVPARSSTWRVKAIDTTGNYSTNAVTTNPTFASVAAADPLDLSFQSRNGYIMVTIPTSGANPLNATHFNLYASLTSGFTPSDSTLVDMTTLYRCDQTTTMCAFAIPSGWDGQTIYMKLGTSDWLTDVLSESEQMSTQFTQTGADPATGSGIVPPAVTETWSFSLGVITLTLAVDDPQSRLSGTRFRWKDGLTAAWSSWTEDLTDPYDLSYDVNLVGTSAVVYIEWQIDYDNDTDTSTIGNIVAVDGDRIPRAAFTPQVDDSGNVSLAWNAIDDDLTGIKALANKSSVTPDYPSDGSVQATGEDTQSPTSTLVTLTKGEDAYIKAFPYNNNDSLHGAVYTAKITYQTDEPGYPVIIEDVEENTSTGVGTVTLTVTSPQGDNLTVDFYEKTGPGAFPGTPDQSTSVSSGGTETYDITLDEAKNVYVKYDVTNTVGTVGGVVVFDPDKIPNITGTLNVTENGEVEFSWQGDSDTASLRYHYVIWYPDDQQGYSFVTDPTSTGNYENGRVGSETVYENGTTTPVVLDQGTRIYMKVRPFNTTNGTGDYGELLQISATRPTDTTGNANLVNNGDFENFYAYWLSPIYTPDRFLLESTSPLAGSYSGKLMANASAVTKIESSASPSGGEGVNIPHIAVEATDKIRVSALCKKDAGAPTLYCYVDWYSNTTTYLSSSTVASWTETTATSKSGTVTAPTSATLCLVRFQIGTGSGYAYIDNVVANFQTNFEVQPLSVLYDVQSSYSPSGGQVLTWSSGNSQWEPADSAGATTLNSLTNVTDSSSASGWYMRSNAALSWVTQSGIPFTDITGTVNADTLDSLDSTAFGRLGSSNTWGQSNDFSQGIIVDSAVSTPTVRLDVGTNASQRAPAGLHWTRAGSTNLWRHAIETDDDLSFERWTGSAWSNVMRLGSDGVVNFSSEPTVGGSPIGDGGNADTVDNYHASDFLLSGSSDTFTGDTLTIQSATPVVDFKFSTAPGGYVETGPAFTNSSSQKRWRYIFNDTDLEFQAWNGSWSTVLHFDVAYDRVEFTQRPTEDGYGAATLGVPVGEVIFSGDDLDALADVNYTTTPSEGQVLIWDNANGYWEPGTAAVGSHTLGSHSNVTDASSASGWYLRTTGATTWAAQSGVPFTDITGTVDADTLDTYDSSAFPRKAENATVTGGWTIQSNTWEIQNSTNAGFISYKYGGTTSADAVVVWRVLDNTTERWGWRYDVAGNTDDMYILKDSTTEVMRLDYSGNKVEFSNRPTVGGTTVALSTDSGSVALLSDIGDVNTGYGNQDLLYNSGGTWVGQTMTELGILHDGLISVQQADSFKGWFGGDFVNLNFEASSGATVSVVDEGATMTVTYGFDSSATGSAWGENDADYNIGIDANGGGTNYFRVRTGTYSAGTVILELNEAGDLTIDGDLVGGNNATGTKWTAYNDGTYATFGASNSGDDVQLQVADAATDNFWLYDGTSRNRIAPIYGWATGTGSPGSVAAVKGALYFRYT